MSAELELAERVLGLVDGDAQATVTRVRTLVARTSAPQAASHEEALGVRVVALHNGRAGTAATDATADDALVAVARRAETAARLAADLRAPRHPGLAEPEPYRTHHGFDPATARLDLGETRVQLQTAADLIDAARFGASARWRAREVRFAIASSAGIRASDAVTEVHADVVLGWGPTRGGFAARSAVAARDIDLPTLVREAEASASPDEPEDVEAGTYPVVLSEYAVGELLGTLATTAFNGLGGALVDRLGTRVAAASINLSDSPRFPGTLPRAFDADGVPKAPVPLIQDGVAHRVVHDRRSAEEAGGAARSTGHALFPGGAPVGPAATNLVLVGGGAEGVEELARPIERGLYVHHLASLHVLDGRRTLVTAVAGNGTRLIEDGRLGRPLFHQRFEVSVLELLAGVQALGSRPRLVSADGYRDPWFAPGVVCPPVRVGALRVARPGPYPPGP